MQWGHIPGSEGAVRENGAEWTHRGQPESTFCHAIPLLCPLFLQFMTAEGQR